MFPMSRRGVYKNVYVLELITSLVWKARLSGNKTFNDICVKICLLIILILRIFYKANPLLNVNKCKHVPGTMEEEGSVLKKYVGLSNIFIRGDIKFKIWKSNWHRNVMAEKEIQLP